MFRAKKGFEVIRVNIGAQNATLNKVIFYRTHPSFSKCEVFQYGEEASKIRQYNLIEKTSFPMDFRKPSCVLNYSP